MKQPLGFGNGQERGAKTQGRPKLLVMAYGCEPDKGSEQGVGWNWALQLARFADVTVITRANNRESISRRVCEGNAIGIQFSYYDLPHFLQRMKNGDRRLYLYYFFWQWGAYLLARRLHKRFSFDCSMQLTFGNIWLPVFIHRLPTDFIWGPIGGGEGVPRQLISEVSSKTRFVQKLRRALILTLRFNPLVLPVLRRARLVLVRTPDTMKILPECVRSKAFCILESGVDPMTLEALRPIAKKNKNQVPIILFTGRLVGFKNVDMLLHAAARARRGGATFRLRLVGDGPERGRLAELSRHLELADYVTFTGSVSRAQVLNELRAADMYAFPSLREGGSWSLMEAMCAALPVICIKTSGMSVVASDDCAICIEPSSREAIIDGIANGIVLLCRSPEHRALLGRRARSRMRDVFLWDRKGEEIFQILARAKPWV